MDKKLSAYQQQFVNSYSGNLLQTMRAIGYDGSDDDLHAKGSRLLNNPEVQEALRSRYTYKVKQDKNIANTDEMLSWWSALVKNEDPHDDSGRPIAMRDRLKASEYIGRANILFGDKQQIEHNVTITNLVESAYQVTDAEVEDIVDTECKEIEVLKTLPKPEEPKKEEKFEWEDDL